MKPTTWKILNGVRHPFTLILILFFLPLFGSKKGDGNHAIEHKNVSFLPSELDHLCLEFEQALLVENDLSAFDSLAAIAMMKAENSFKKEYILLTNLRVLKVIDDGTYYKIDFNRLIERTEELSLKLDDYSGFETWLTLSKSAARMFEADLANKFALKSFSEISLEKTTAKRVEAYLALGKSLFLKKEFSKSYQNYLHAKTQVEMIQDHNKYIALKKACYDHFFDFFDELKDFKEAENHKYDQINLILEEKPVDSLELMWAKLDMLGISIRAQKYRNLKKKFDELLNYAERSKHKRLHDYTMSKYRTFLIETNDSEGYNYLYFEKYPDELYKMQFIDPVSYFRIKAHIADYQMDFDKAMRYYQKAKELIKEDKNPVYRANFYRRFGQFLLKKKMDGEALEAFYLSYREASEQSYLDYMIEASYYIDSLSYANGQIAEAYKYSKIHNQLRKDQSEMAEDEQYMMMNLRNEKKRMEVLQKREANAQKKQFDLQYFFIGALISFLMMIFVIASQMKVPLWVVKGSGFVGVLMIFEFIILILDQEIHHMTHGAPLWIFIIKVLILFVLFPLHHLVEKAVINYMVDKKLVLKPQKGSLKKVLHTIWPWMKE